MNSVVGRCASCNERKETPFRVGFMGGYVCLTCVDARLQSDHDLIASQAAEIERLRELVSSSEAERYRSCSELLERAGTAENRADVAEYKLGQAVNVVQPMVISRAETAERERDEAIAANYRQAGCIHQCAAHLGPDASGTIDGLPLAVKAAVTERDEARRLLAEATGALERIARLFDGIRSAVETNQVVDKDVHGTAISGRDLARTTLSNIRGHNG